MVQALRLAVADFFHDRVLYACTVITLIGVTAPLLILAGLKNGYIESLRNSLRANPRHLEIRPRSVPNLLSAAWFEKYHARPDVAFIVPSVIQNERGTAFATTLLRPDSGEDAEGVSVDPICTAQGDPLLAWNGIGDPATDQCVLSEAAAHGLGVAEGDAIMLKIRRTGGFAVRRFVVKGTVPKGTLAKSAVFLRLEMMERIRLFKYGFAVPEYDWPGGNNLIAPAFSELILFTDEELPMSLLPQLQVGTGFSRLNPLDAEGVSNATLLRGVEGTRAFRLESVGRPGDLSNVDRVAVKLGGYRHALVPANPGFLVELKGGAGSRPLRAVGHGIAGAGELIQDPGGQLEWTSLLVQRERPIGEWVRTILVSPETQEAVGQPPWELSIDMPEGKLRFPVSVGESLALKGADAMIPAVLSGILRSGQRVTGIRYREADGNFVVGNGGFPSFRLFARDMSSVGPLVRDLEAEGILVEADVEAIENISRTDAQLGQVVKMIAGITVVGAMVALAAGLLMSVERKKREFGLLRLYGFPPALLLIFVGLQSLILSGLALGSAMLLIPLLNRLQVGLMDASGGGAEFPVLLMADNIVDFSSGGAGIALAVSLVTGIRLLAIEPADAIRWR